MLTVRDAIPKARDLAKAEFATLRLRLIKIAVRVVETTSRVRLAFAGPSPPARNQQYRSAGGEKDERCRPPEISLSKTHANVYRRDAPK